jgi:hypothetical protein
MSGWNLPPGVYERDLPGYNDTDVTVDVYCSNCESDVEAELTGNGDSVWGTVNCLNCGHSFEYENDTYFADLARDQDDYYREQYENRSW